MQWTEQKNQNTVVTHFHIRWMDLDVRASAYPEVCVAVDYHGAFDQLIRTLQKRMPGDHAGVVDQYVHLTYIPAYLLGSGVHALPFPHVTHIGVDLWLRWGDLLDTPSWLWKMSRARARC